VTTIVLNRLTATYYQEGDDCDTGADQLLTLTLDTAGAGPYLVVSTERWAMNHPKELHRLMKAFVAAGAPLFEEPSCLSD
jgi:hypothetical protein